MLAIGRALAINPRLLLLDEPTEGLAPIIIEELLRALRKLFVEEGMAGIVVEQQARKILPITDRAIVLDRGRIVFDVRRTARGLRCSTSISALPGRSCAGGAHSCGASCLRKTRHWSGAPSERQGFENFRNFRKKRLHAPTVIPTSG